MPTLVQPVVVARTTTTAMAATITGVTAGNTLIALFAANTGTGTLSGITDSAGNTVNIDVAFAGASQQIAIVSVPNASAGSHTLSGTLAVAGNADIFIGEYPGNLVLDLASAVASATTSTAIATASITTTVNGDLVVGGFSASGSARTFSAYTNGFTQEAVNTSGPTPGFADVTQATAGAIGLGATVNTAVNWSAAIAAYRSALGAPTITSVNGGSAIAEGATGVAVVGTNFANGMTSAIAQTGVSVAQATTFGSSTGASFNLSMEPAGSQLAFTDATYATTYTVTVSGQTSAGKSITLTPPAGLIFQTLASVNPTSSQRITATPDLVAGDQLEAAGDAAGTVAVPTGLSLNNDATYQFAAGDTPANFWVRAYDGTAKVWGAWAEQTVVPAPSSQNGAVFHRRHSRVILPAA